MQYEHMPKRLMVIERAGHQFCSDLCWIGRDHGGIADIAERAGVWQAPLFRGALAALLSWPRPPTIPLSRPSFPRVPPGYALYPSAQVALWGGGGRDMNVACVEGFIAFRAACPHRSLTAAGSSQSAVWYRGTHSRGLHQRLDLFLLRANRAGQRRLQLRWRHAVPEP